MKTLKEKIEIMQAAEDGARIEYLLSDMERWIEYSSPRDLAWDWSSSDYRIKEEPREIWHGVDPQTSYIHREGFESKQACEQAFPIDREGRFMRPVLFREVEES